MISGSKEYKNDKFVQEVRLQSYFSKLKKKQYVNIYRYQNLISLLSQWLSFYYNWGKLIKKNLYKGIWYEDTSSDLSTLEKYLEEKANNYLKTQPNKPKRRIKK